MSEQVDQTPEVVLDCEQGRRMGCRNFCCALIVRLEPGETDPTDPANLSKSCIDKNPSSGRCKHQDSANGRCDIWEQRPKICRSYDCNHDGNLQIVLRAGFSSLTQLMTARPPSGAKLKVPYIAKRNAS